MEPFVFIGGAVVVIVILIWRGRAGGSGSRVFGPDEDQPAGPINYGSTVAPPGTSAGASTNAPWFGRDHSGPSHGGGAGDE